MCGILGYKIKGDNSRIQLRGQDYTNRFGYKGFTFVHNLLSITGEFTPQPFVSDDIVCLYNGEIYNHKFIKSDGEVLIPLYKKYGTDFPKYLDGEFAIVLFDFKKEIAIFVTDPFKTKPLFINGLDFASYRSGVGGHKMPPNTILVKKLDNTVIEEKNVVEWDFRQYKTTYDDWLEAFRQSIRKRAKDNCFIGLSSGYDSGAIMCEMMEQDIDFKGYIFRGSENQQVLEKRASYVEHEYFEPNRNLLPWLKDNCDDEPYTIKYNGKITDYTFLTEGGTLGVATFCNLANREGRKVCLSSQGADEILSDYNKFPDQSELKKFPKDLKPWYNFNYGCQESYLIKEEYAGGAFNIETRYPFLDKQLVQEFLWLTPELKNAHYKAPLREYLIKHNFPFEQDVKRGFSIFI